MEIWSRGLVCYEIQRKVDAYNYPVYYSEGSSYQAMRPCKLVR